MRRRDLIFGLGSAAALPRLARAQQKPMPVIGFLANGSRVSLTEFIAAFSQGLGETGYVEHRNVAIEYRLTEGRYDRLPALIADLVERKVDVIATIGTPTARSAKSTTSTIPIVFGLGSDPMTVVSSRCPRALTRRTQKPLSSLWKVTRSISPEISSVASLR